MSVANDTKHQRSAESAVMAHANRGFSRLEKALGITGKMHFRERDDHTTGDLLVDAIDLDGQDICESLHVIASELDLLIDAIEPDLNRVTALPVFSSIVNRLRVLAEVQKRITNAVDAELRKLTGVPKKWSGEGARGAKESAMGVDLGELVDMTENRKRRSRTVNRRAAARRSRAR